jgi:hypothetical protein
MSDFFAAKSTFASATVAQRTNKSCAKASQKHQFFIFIAVTYNDQVRLITALPLNFLHLGMKMKLIYNDTLIHKKIIFEDGCLLGCSVMQSGRYFRGAYCLNHQGDKS